MAQERARRARGLARRYGVSGRAAVAAALALLAAAGVVAALAVVPALSGGGVVVERGGEVTAAPGQAETDTERADGEGQEAPAADEAPATLLVHVDGAVAAPGVYELAEGARANDAVLAAGGLAEGADTSALNLAAPLSDGEKLHVPREGEEVVASGTGDAAASEQGASTGATTPVNLNTATVEELDTLPGVGEATARAIVEDREANGPFATIEDLMRVSGIGEKKFERIRGLVCV